jgi:hypothetical protein
MDSTTRKNDSDTAQAAEHSLEQRSCVEFSNVETWIAFRCLRDDEGMRRTWEERAFEILRAVGGSVDWTVRQVAGELRESVEAEFRSNFSGLAGDLLQNAVGKVVWYEVAREILLDELLQPELPADALFQLGKVETTPGVSWRIPFSDRSPALARHVRGDWGDIPQEDRDKNERALRGESLRLLSAHQTANGVRFCVLTESDRSKTTLLLPEEC